MARILVVDDAPEVCESLSRFLAAAGHRVASAANGREALIQVRNQTPDLIVLDLAMPEMDGPSFMEVARSYLSLQTLPVVVLTGLGDSPMVERARRLNVSSVLAKGQSTPDEILETVEGALVSQPE